MVDKLLSALPILLVMVDKLLSALPILLVVGRNYLLAKRGSGNLLSPPKCRPSTPNPRNQQIYSTLPKPNWCTV
jgi:hypothetical protein